MPNTRSKPSIRSVPSSGTESVHARAEKLDLLPMAEVIQLMHAEDLAAVAAVGAVLSSVVALAEMAATCLRSGGRVIYAGAGTSGRLGLLDAAEAPPTFGTHPKQIQAILAGGNRAIVRAIEGAEDDGPEGERAALRLRLGLNDLVIGLSASATTPFVLGALKAAKRAGAKTALIACNPQGVKRGSANLLVLPDTGPELLAGSTRLKAGTATKLVLNAVSTAAMVSLGKVYRGRMVDLRATNKKLKQRARRMVEELAGLSSSQADALLKKADGSPKVALAMHFAGLSRAEAVRRLRKATLREIAEKISTP